MARALLEVHDYTDEQEDILYALSVTCSTLSFLGSLFIMFNYCTFREFKQNFAFKLIFCVAIGDFLSSVGNFLGNPQDKDAVCIIQGIFAELGALTSICWVTAISLSIWLVISRETPPTSQDTNHWLKKMYMVIWTYIIICALLPFTTDSYGPAGGWCWIKGKETADNVWRFALFYIPLWLCVAFMSFVYCRVWSRLNATAQDTQRSEAFLDHDENEDSYSGQAGDEEERRRSSANKDNSSRSTTLQRMKYYPMVLIVCYAPATVRRLSELFGGTTTPWGFAAVQIVSAGIIGFVNAIVYAFSQKVVRERDAQFFRDNCCCGRKNAKVDFPLEVPPRDVVQLGDGLEDRI